MNIAYLIMAVLGFFWLMSDQVYAFTRPKPKRHPRIIHRIGQEPGGAR